MRCFISLFALFACCLAASAQCRDGKCSGPAAPPAVVSGPPRWVTYDGIPGVRYLYRGQAVAGLQNLDTKVYLPFDGLQFLAAAEVPSDAPTEEPSERSPAVSQVLPTGVDESKLGGSESFRLNGRTVTKAQAQDLLASPQAGLPADERMPWLVLIARDRDTRKRMESDLEEAKSSAFLGQFRRIVYDLSDPVDAEMVEPFKASESTAIKERGAVCFVQTADGKDAGRVICQVSGWEGVSQLESALRKADPKWDPNRVPNPAPSPLPLPSLPAVEPFRLNAVPVWVWVTSGMLLLVVFLRVR